MQTCIQLRPTCLSSPNPKLSGPKCGASLDKAQPHRCTLNPKLPKTQTLNPKP